ncbi:hypothetical protein AGOR_G00201030 [Albula goreensis]|uniref:Uncharacterized protein n=1 Tax=Albula goreensis TaxID=1534307 RepID=A0A8T3CP65_9TELE|nr:hypothetical protein AGOR_G00201030 [Albula goreensis]
MSNWVTFQTQLASIMDLLVKAAVAEMGNLVEDSAIVLRLEVADNEVLKKKIQTENELMTTRFASIMGTLSKEAVDKITKLVDETAQQLMELEARTVQDAARDSSLHMVYVGEIMEEHDVVVKEEDSPMHSVVLKDKSAGLDEDGAECPLNSERGPEDNSVTTNPPQGLNTSVDRAARARSDVERSFLNDHQYCEENNNMEYDIQPILARFLYVSRQILEVKGNADSEQQHTRQ